MLVFGILALALGVFCVLPASSQIMNPTYRDIWWFLVALGGIAILWGLVAGRRGQAAD